MYPLLEHPAITRVLRTGYPDRPIEDLEEFDEDALYEERREEADGEE